MSHETELETVKRRIRGLVEKTVENGATEAEAIMAMAKVGELLERFNLSLDEITVRQQACVTRRYDTGSKHLGVEGNVLMAIGRYVSCQVWTTRGKNGITLNIFGIESDADLGIYLIKVISSAYVTEHNKFRASEQYINYLGHRRVLTSNFEKGFVEGIRYRLDDMLDRRREREQEEMARRDEELASRAVGATDAAKAEGSKMTTGTSLVMIAKEDYIEEEFGKLGLKLKTTRRYSYAQRNSMARIAGSRASQNVNLSNPITSGSNNVSGYIR